jgi:hypothetical protein
MAISRDATFDLLSEASAQLDRYVDLAISIREDGDSNARILEVGGEWDRRDLCWSGDASSAVIWRLQPAQYEIGYWLAEWFAAYSAKVPAGERAPSLRDIYAVMFEGGRGGGKSDLAVRALTAFAVAFQGRISWAVSPSQEETAELATTIRNLIPISDSYPAPGCWAVYRDRPHFEFSLWNGSSIRLLSGYKPGTLKRGRVDMWLMNEAQRFPKKAYTMIRPRLADTSGLGIMACNPPDSSIGTWLGNFHDDAVARKIPDVRVFYVDPKRNPKIDYRSLELLRPSFGEDDFRREILGEFIPVGDFVNYAWSDLQNILPRPDLGNITAKFTELHLGTAFGCVLGMDFQKTPYHVAEPALFYGDMDDAHLWFMPGITAEGTEDDLLDALEAAGYDKDRCAIIADASGEWQDAERTKGGGSYDMLRKRGWRHIFRPDRRMKKNPSIAERTKAFNARICSSTGVRRVFAVPQALDSNRATKLWENKNGYPNKRSDYAHVCDARAYVVWRFWPRHAPRDRVAFERVEKVSSSRLRDLENL